MPNIFDEALKKLKTISLTCDIGLPDFIEIFDEFKPLDRDRLESDFKLIREALERGKQLEEENAKLKEITTIE